MKRIYLHGVFAEHFDKEWELNVASPSEAINAIDVNTNGKFREMILNMAQNGDDLAIASVGKRQARKIEEFLDKDEFDEGLLDHIFCNADTIHCQSKDSHLHIIPIIQGEAIFTPMLLAVGKMAKAAGVAMKGMSLSKAAFNILAPIAVSAIANALFPSPKVTDQTRRTKSYLFDDRPNTTAQGAPIPVGYGTLKIGSNTISYNRTNKDKGGSAKGGLIETFTTYNVYDVLSEGPIGGLCDMAGNICGEKSDGDINIYNTFDDNLALKSVFLSDMVVMNHPAKTLNFLLNEDDVQPSGTLGYMDKSLEPGSSFFIAGESESNTSSMLPGPDKGSNSPPAVLTGLPTVFQNAQSNGAKIFSYPITRNYTQVLKITLSPKSMFHNWTDQRTRRGFFGIGARSKVVTGTSAVSISLVACVRDGPATIPLIFPRDSGGWGGGEGGTIWASTSNSQRRVTGYLGSSNQVSDPSPWSTNQSNLVRKFSLAIFFGDNSIFAECNSIFNFVEKFRLALTSSEVLSASFNFANTGGLKLVEAIDQIYSDDQYESKRTSTGEVLVDLVSAIRTGQPPLEIAYKYYGQIMPLIKKETYKKYGISNRAGFRVLGADGVIYACGKKQYSTLTIHGLCTSPAGLDMHIALPYFGPSENLVLTLCRTTNELSDPKDLRDKNNKMNLSAVTSLDGVMGKTIKYSHPGVACIKVPFDAVNFPQLPERNYVAKLKKIAVPSNYNPLTRKYYGAWNGLFKGQTKNDLTYGGITERHLEWTDNPAWILADILLNRRYGVGSYGFTIADIDIWKLYAAAKFCDELVETGFPLESPKRKFTSNNIPQSKESFLSTKPSQNSFLVRVLYDHTNDANEKKMSFLSEFNLGNDNVKISAGRKVAFFMSDGSIEERVVISVNPSSQTIKLMGPNFWDSSAIDRSSGLATGECVMSVSYPIVEPRFSANMLFKQKEEALRAVKEICTVFRTVVAYSAGKVSFASEHKKDPSMIFTDANVSEEGFSYAGSPRTSRITACKVRYADKFDNFRSKVEYYEDSGSIDKFGYKLEEILAVGCTSRGQARRLAKFTVLAPNLENEYTTFETGMEASLLAPGAIIEVSDSRRFGENVNGRIKKIDLSNQSVLVDKVMDNLSFYNPSSPNDPRNPVELTVMCGRGYETVGENSVGAKDKTGLYKKMFSLSQDVDSFDVEEQMSMISGISRPQLVYFDGFVDHADNSITDLKSKYRFTPNVGGGTIKSNSHGLSNGETIRFTSFGRLPTGLESNKDYTVVITDPLQQKNSFQITDGGSAVNITDLGFKVETGGESPEIPGGEHFYYVSSSNIKTIANLSNIDVGAVWSIRGYKRDAMQSVQEYDEGLVNTIHQQLGGEDIPNSVYKKSPALGRYKIFDISNLDATSTQKKVTVRQKSAKGLGLGDIQLIVDSSGVFDSSKFQYKYSAVNLSWLKVFRLGGDRENGGWVKQISNDVFLIHEPLGATDITLSPKYFIERVNVDSDIYHISAADSSSISSTIILGQSSFDVTTIASRHYIRISNREISAEDLLDFAPSAYSSQSPVQDFENDITADINSFKNAGRMQYRIVSITEVDPGKYKIKASEYNKDKFDLIERELAIQKPVFPIPPQVSMDAPAAPEIVEIVDLTQSV